MGGGLVCLSIRGKQSIIFGYRGFYSECSSLSPCWCRTQSIEIFLKCCSILFTLPCSGGGRCGFIGTSSHCAHATFLYPLIRRINPFLLAVCDLLEWITRRALARFGTGSAD